MKKLLGLATIVALFAVGVFADIRVDTPKPTPKNPKSIDTRLDVKIRSDATEARLLIPKNQLKELRAELEGLGVDTETRAAAGITKTQTVVSGLFLSFAFVFGGVWLMRSRKVNKTVVIGSALFVCGTVATIVYANAGPPPEARTLTDKFFSREVNTYKFGSGKIKLEVSSDVSSPTLIVPDVKSDKKSDDE